MEFGVITWLLDNTTTRVLDAIELVAIASIYVYFRAENKKMQKLIDETDNRHAPKSVQHEVAGLKLEVTGLRDKVDSGFAALSTQIANLANTVIDAVSHRG